MKKLAKYYLIRYLINTSLIISSLLFLAFDHFIIKGVNSFEGKFIIPIFFFNILFAFVYYQLYNLSEKIKNRKIKINI